MDVSEKKTETLLFFKFPFGEKKIEPLFQFAARVFFSYQVGRFSIRVYSSSRTKEI